MVLLSTDRLIDNDVDKEPATRARGAGCPYSPNCLGVVFPETGEYPNFRIFRNVGICRNISRLKGFCTKSFSDAQLPESGLLKTTTSGGAIRIYVRPGKTFQS